MPQMPKPWYWRQWQISCVYLNGKNVVLGHDRTEAHRKFHERRAAELEYVASDSVVAIIDTFLERIKDGGGDETEDIEVHVIPLAQADTWLERNRAAGVLLDPKVFAALHLAKQHA